MTLATRCPKCQTVFRVVQDQLRVSEGWVRCGRCSEVFNAVQHLVDPTTGEPRRAPIELHSGLAQPLRSEEGLPAPTPSAAPAPPGSPAAPAAVAGPGAAAAGTQFATPAPQPPLRDEIPPDVAEFFDSQVPKDDDAIVRLAPADDWDFEPPRSAADGAATLAPTPAAEPPAAQASALPSAPAELPSFVQRARRAERWRRPGVRAALALGSLVAALTLVLQAVLAYRDHLAARWPATRPLLASACAALGCRIEPLHAIDALVVDSSGLVRVENSDLYKLGVALRNQRELEVALPAVDLALTDARGQLIARRVLRAAELGASAATVAARGELALQATLRVESTPVAGYTIELFYP